MLSSVVVAERSIVLGAPEAVLGRCLGAVPHDVVDDLAERGRRVLAVAEGRWHPGEPENNAETALTLLALIGFEDPPRPDVAEALAACRSAGIKVAMITGDHPGTAAAVARKVGLLGERGVVLDAGQLPKSDEDLAAYLDGEDGAVGARATPSQKLRIARVLRQRGHVVALARLLGGTWPPPVGWALAFCAAPIVIIVDASFKAWRRFSSRELALASAEITSGGLR